MSNYLQHHGIKGQKWGVRRFQNEDGSYTSEGKERYGKATAKTLNKEQKNADDAEKKKRSETAKKIFVAAAAASLTAAAAYATSKHIKNKSNSMLNREHGKKLRTIFNQHYLYDSTNADLNAQMRYRDYIRSKESLMYIPKRKH